MPLEGNLTVTSSNFVSRAPEMDDKFHTWRQQHELDRQQQHEHQLQEHFKMVLSQQRQEADQMKAANKTNELINSIKNKDKNKESAVASNAVKKHLQKFVIGRQKGKILDSYPSSLLDRPRGLHWAPSLDERTDSHDAIYPAGVYDNKYDDFPLRKTASEPNLKVRSRLKQKLSTDQRSSPLLARRNDVKADLANRLRKRINPELVNQTSESCNSAPNSTPSSPPNADIPMLSAIPHVEADLHGLNLHKPSDPSSSGDLYTSPSLPNILIGMSQKHGSEKGAFLLRDHDLSPLVSRTSSLPGPLTQSTSKRLSYSPPGPSCAPSKISSPPGPIRPSHLTRPHKTLIRTHSAPTTASQLQHHILQRKQARILQQQQKLLQNLGYVTRPEFAHLYPNLLPTHLENDDKQESYLKQYQAYKGLASARFPDLAEEKFTSENAEVHYPRNDSVHRVNFAPHPIPLLIKPDLPSTVQEEDLLQNSSYPQTIPETKYVKRIHELSHKPLLRTQSSPVTSFMKKDLSQEQYRCTTGIAYSPVMLKHGCACGDDHIENGGRLQAIWERLTKCGLVSDKPHTESMCELIDARKATTDELQLVHTQDHTLRYGTTSLARKELDLCSKFIVLPCGGVGVDNGIDIETVWNELDTINAARMAVGCTVDLALLVAENKLKNGFALVRPPGHHAQKSLAMAFCYFNSVAVAARKLQAEAKMRRILIVDWDIHHCNGTQNIFYHDATVLVISLHRYDDGKFFPGTGAIQEVGAGRGVGYNVNIAFNSGLQPPMGDAEYLAAFHAVVLPIAQEFDPDFVLVSSGFSAAKGHPPALGGYTVSPQCFGYLTQSLSHLANGRLVLVLEGGFELQSLSDCSEACVRVLLGDSEFASLPEESITQKPHNLAVTAIRRVISIQAKYWRWLDVSLANLSHQEWTSLARENETVRAMASLSVKAQNNVNMRERMTSWHSEHRTCSMDKGTSGESFPKDNETSKALYENVLVVDEKSPSDISMSAESSPLDVVGTSNPSSPCSVPNLNRTDEIIDDVSNNREECMSKEAS
ncbi:histone deacetylase 4-like isoform X2 [Clavelina lepadiformis]|uniref:histone deacetylase 4-like isoform X2 n=1 Tax=Clavelina lepadiformis TaxID=159417 RepID=UPI004040F16D